MTDAASIPASCATETGSIAPTSRMKEFRDGEHLPAMLPLPRGEFIMGENVGDKFANDTERPAHRVEFACPFALGKFPVTVGEFRQFRAATSPEDAKDLPVVRVSWHEAMEYCDWLTQRTGRRYRLPSEAEWEYACRAGSQTPFSTGEELSPRDANYLYDESGTRVGPGRPTPVGSFPANRFGFHDLHGNVAEWVADSWLPDYLGAAGDGRARSAGGEERRVIRGGAWDYLPRLLRSSWRDWRPADYRADNLGFRVATDDGKELSC